MSGLKKMMLHENSLNPIQRINDFLKREVQNEFEEYLKEKEMNITQPLKELFPPEPNGYREMPYLGYQQVVDSLGFRTLLEVSDNDYQGDTRILLKNADSKAYGFLIFGWGSCSGCDWLEGCNTYEELEELRQSLYTNIVWKPDAQSMIEFLEQKDWEVTFYRKEETQEFVDKALDILRNGEKGKWATIPNSTVNSLLTSL